MVQKIIWISLVASLARSAELPQPGYENRFNLQPLLEYGYRVANEADGTMLTEDVVREYASNSFTGNPGPYTSHGFTPVVRYMGSAGGVDGSGDLEEKTYAYSTVFPDLENKLKGVLKGNGGFAVDFNGNRWDFAFEGPLGFIRSHEVANDARRDPDAVKRAGWAKNVPRWTMRNAQGGVLIHADGMGLVCNSRYNTVHRTYKRRNLEALATRIGELWERYPRQFTSLTGDSETEQPNSDENPLTKLEFQDWIAHKGIYEINTLTVSLWYHQGQTGVKNVVYDPDGMKRVLTLSDYRFQGWPDANDAAPGYGLILVTRPEVWGATPPGLQEDRLVSYEVIGGADNGKVFQAKAEYFGDQGRNGGVGDYTHFMKALNDHMIEDYLKWLHLKLVGMGHSASAVRSRLYSHEVGVERNNVTYSAYDATLSTTPDARYGSSGITVYGAIPEAMAKKIRDNSQNGYKNWGNFEWNRFGTPAETQSDLQVYLKYGAHSIAANGWGIPNFNINDQAGYRTATQSLIAAHGWLPWIQGADNSTATAKTIHYTPPPIRAPMAEITVPGMTLVSWSPYIWADWEYRYIDWPDFKSFEIQKDGITIAVTRAPWAIVPTFSGKVTVIARSLAGVSSAVIVPPAKLKAISLTARIPTPGKISLQLENGNIPADFSSEGRTAHWERGNLNTGFLCQVKENGVWKSLTEAQYTHASLPSDVRLDLKDGKRFQFGDYQGMRFKPPQGWKIDSVNFDYLSDLGLNAQLEVWSGDSLGHELRVGSPFVSASGKGSLPVTLGRDGWIEFRLALGKGGDSETSNPVRNVVAAGNYALVSGIRIHYHKKQRTGNPSLPAVFGKGTLSLNGARDTAWIPFVKGQSLLEFSGTGLISFKWGPVNLNCLVTTSGIEGENGGPCRIEDLSLHAKERSKRSLLMKSREFDLKGRRSAKKPGLKQAAQSAHPEAPRFLY